MKRTLTTNKDKLERVNVSIRIRPFSEDEKKKDPTSPIDNIDLTNNTLRSKKKLINFI
jgi:hypothetical protein